MTYIFAHRGSSGTHPENTMEAFAAAEKAGADGIELDVQLSADGEVIVIHDETVDRTTNGKGFVQGHTVKELKCLNANYKFKSIFHKARIPMLREVFDWLLGNQLICNIELKNTAMPYEGMEEKVLSLIAAYGLEKRVILSSFNHASLVLCKKLAPWVEIAPLYRDGLYMPWVYARSLEAGGIHPKLRAVNRNVIEKAMEYGVAVRPYTVNKEKDMKKLFLLNCSAIITDYPKKAVQLRERCI